MKKKSEHKPLLVGDYVHCYTGEVISAEGSECTPGSFGGTITKRDGDIVYVKLSFFKDYTHRFHVKQCRRLRKKKTEENRERYRGIVRVSTKGNPLFSRNVEVVELLIGERIFSRESLSCILHMALAIGTVEENLILKTAFPENA